MNLRRGNASAGGMIGRTLLTAAMVAALALPAQALELLMFRRAGCPWCLQWDRAIGPIYGKTEFGRTAPIRMVDLDRDKPDVELARPVVFTPTFVLVAGKRERGRIEGYPGEDFFWARLERLVREHADAPAPATN
jgi:hypothetical protein